MTQQARSATSPPSSGPRAGGFTLVELLISLAIVATLIAIILPAIRTAVSTARGFRCQMSLRSTAFDFSVFADERLHGDRGNDATDLPANAFRLETFQELQYGIDEFWTYGNVASFSLPDRQGRDPMRCSEVKGEITVRRDTPCASGGVGPDQNISFAFNMRLHMSDRQALAGRSPLVLLTSNILSGNTEVSPDKIPLLFDADGVAAARGGRSAVFSAPGLDSPALFTDNAYWFPGLRHAGAMNVAFIDGRVATTRRPLDEPAMAWGFDAGR